MSSTAAAAAQAASQLGAAIAAYEAAFAATVPPPLIAANRALLAVFVAANIVGQNTPAIAAIEALYAEMWAQDAGAMYGYAGASAAATTVTPFNPPPPTTNPAGTGTQAAAVTRAAASPAGAAQNVLSQVPAALQSLNGSLQSLPDSATSGILGGLASPGSQALEGFLGGAGGDISDFGTFTFPVVGFTNWLAPLYMGAGGMGASAAPAAAAIDAAPALATRATGLGGLAAGLTGSYGPGVSAGLGGAATVGGLSVPQSWATASPAIRLAATALPVAGLDGLPPAGETGLGGFGGMPMMGGLVNASGSGADRPRPESRLKVIPELARESGVHEGIPDRGMTPTGRAVDAVDALSERERHELRRLREEIADLAMERDAVDRLIKEAMRR
jgi:PPE-repeat protein